MSNTIVYFKCEETDHLIIFNSPWDEESEAIESYLALLKDDYDVESFTFDYENNKGHVYLNAFKYTIETMYCDEVTQVYTNEPNFEK